MWMKTKLVAMVFLGVEAVARDVKAMMPGRVVRVVEVKPTSGQANGGVPVLPKTSADKGAATASSPKSKYASLFTTVGATPNAVGNPSKALAANRSGSFTGDPSPALCKIDPHEAMSYEQTPGDQYGADDDQNGTCSTFPSIAAAAGTKPPGGSRFLSRSAPSKVAMQTILGTCVTLATGSAIAGGVSVLLGAATVDAAEVPMDTTTWDDESACGNSADTLKWLFLLASTAVTVALKAFAVLYAIKEFDETAQYVYRRALPYWEGLCGMLDFMLTL